MLILTSSKQVALRDATGLRDEFAPTFRRFISEDELLIATSFQLD
jgi:hypothetical protein